MDKRAYWISVTSKISAPVLQALAARELRVRMPVESAAGATDRAKYTHLEAIGRLLAGIAPWLELGEPAAAEFADLARTGLDALTDPASPDYGNFTEGGQPLVDAAFLAQAILRAPNALWERLEPRVQRNLATALRSTRAIVPPPCNWLLFSATIEAALHRMGEPDWDGMRIDYALRQHEQWYKGDGHYGDGAAFHADYYNAFVIQPMLVDVIREVGELRPWAGFADRILARAARYAEVQERSISPEGTFPVIGRSLAYRFGAFQALAQIALLGKLPEGITPPQVRDALTAVIRRLIEAPGTFDAAGWLRIGLCGAQLSLGEAYISTGSLYLCSTALLPLGLPAENEFWSGPETPWTSVKAWGGVDLAADHAI